MFNLAVLFYLLFYYRDVVCKEVRTTCIILLCFILYFDNFLNQFIHFQLFPINS